MGQEGIEPPLLVLQTSALTNLATDPIIVVPAGIEPAISTFKVWWLCQRRLQDNNGYFCNLFNNSLSNNTLAFFTLTSFLNLSLLDSIEPSNTTFSLFTITYFFLRRVWDSNPQDLLHVLLLFKSSPSSSQILSILL